MRDMALPSTPVQVRSLLSLSLSLSLSRSLSLSLSLSMYVDIYTYIYMYIYIYVYTDAVFFIVLQCVAVCWCISVWRVVLSFVCVCV